MTNETSSAAIDDASRIPVSRATFASCDISSLQSIPQESIKAIAENTHIKIFFQLKDTDEK